MKKILVLFLCLTMVITSLVFTVNAADNLNITVASDTHYSLLEADDVYEKENDISEDYSHVLSGGSMDKEAFAICEAFFSKIANNESSVVILSGDLVEVGDKEAEVAFAARLAKFEKDTGKRVFVVPGNHDLSGLNREEFKAIYADLCYNEAIEVDDNTASYTAELNGSYRLLVIDSCDLGSSYSGMNDELVEWIEAQAKKAQDDGKHLIASMHHGLLDHYIIESEVREEASVPAEFGLPELFAKYDIKYTFTGHNHEHDISAYDAEDGTKIYDAATGSLSTYPAAYRVVNFTDSNVEFKTEHIEKIDTSLLAPGMSAKALSDAKNNFPLYAKNCFSVGAQVRFEKMFAAKALKSIFGITDKNNPEISTVFDKIGDRVAEAMALPLYKKDAAGGESIEGHLAECGELLTKTDCKTTLELLAELYAIHVEGDENVPAHKGVTAAFLDSVAAVIHYATADLTDEEYVVLLNFLIVDILNQDPLSENLLTFATSATGRFQGISIVISYALYPVVDEFMVDDAPADNDVTLSAYDRLPDPVQESISFFEMLRQKLMSFIAWIKQVFSF